MVVCQPHGQVEPFAHPRVVVPTRNPKLKYVLNHLVDRASPQIRTPPKQFVVLDAARFIPNPFTFGDGVGKPYARVREHAANPLRVGKVVPNQRNTQVRKLKPHF